MLNVDTREAVERWLKVIGCTPVEQEDPQASWHVLVNYPAKTPHQMHVVAPQANPEAVVIATLVSVSPEHVKAFDNLDDVSKDDFLFELRRTLNITDVDFQAQGASGPLDCPTQIQISATRYLDGLTLDSFARSAGSVFKTFLNVVWLVQHRLGTNGSGPSGRFDFKRLGL